MELRTSAGGFSDNPDVRILRHDEGTECETTR